MRTIELTDAQYEALVKAHGDVTAFVQRLVAEAEEVAAVMEGVQSYKEGRHRPVEEFMDEFMAEQGIRPES